MARIHNTDTIKRLAAYVQMEKQFLHKHPEYNEVLKDLIKQLAAGEQIGKRLSKGHKINFTNTIKAYDIHITPRMNKYILWVDYINVDGKSVLLLVAITDHDHYKNKLKKLDYRNMKDYKTESVLVEALEIHDELNPKLFDQNEKLKPDVRQKILEIVDEFLDNVQNMTEITLNPIDVYLLGSNASYNYTKYSDADVHIVINFDTIDDNTGLVQALMNLQKADFNSSYDVSIYGIDVELYVEDVRSSTLSNGIYSVMNDDWVKKPQPITDVPEIDIEDDLDEWKDKINDVLNSKDIDKIAKTIDDLYIMRKNGLMTDGEYSRGNQIFKEIRNLSLLKDLKDAFIDLRSKELSLENKRRNTNMIPLRESLDDLWFYSIENEEEALTNPEWGISDKKIDYIISTYDNVERLLKARRSDIVFISLNLIEEYIDPEFISHFKRVKTIQKYNLALMEDDKGNKIVTEPRYGTLDVYFKDEDTARDILAAYEVDFDTYEEEPYTPSSTNRDYGPSNPWDAPGMSTDMFI